jgi:nitrite reductase (NO-forming)
MTKPLLAVLALVGLLAAGCDDGEAPTDEGAAPAVGDEDVVAIDVVMGDIFYQPDSVEIPAGTSLEVNAVNEGDLEHDFELDDQSGTGILQAGEDTTAEVAPFDEDTTAYCTVAGHREAGMEFEIVVTD